jgi:hypothetical protein
MTTPTVTELVRNGNVIRQAAEVGERVELARYAVSSGRRILYGQRIDGVVRITDCPADAAGRAYLVERELEADGYGPLQALITDYLAQARALDAVPMVRSLLRAHQEAER